jgi:hypothetical protein
MPINRYRLTLIVTVFLTASFFVYSLGVGLLVDAQQRVPGAEPVVQVDVSTREPGESARVAREYLADQPWAEEADIQLRDGEKLFYFAETWTQLEDKRQMKFEPLAMVWFDEPNKEPITIIAESAIVTFQRELEISNPNPGRVIGGQLTGRVLITGDDNLSIAGRHFIFSEKSARIWSDNAVAFTFQQHKGHSERGIQIDLDTLSNPKPGSHLAVANVRQVHLFRNVSMHFLFDQDNETIQLNVKCAGSFTMDFNDGSPGEAQTMFATFQDDVVVERPVEGQQIDRLTADKLSLHLERSHEPNEKLPLREMPNIGKSSEKIILKQLDAIGDRRQVVLTSEANDMEARMRLFSYYPEQRKAVMRFDEQLTIKEATTLENGKAPIRFERVIVRQGDSELHCFEVEFGHDRKGKIEQVVCRGAGWLNYTEVREENKRLQRRSVLSVQWQKMLRKYPDDKSNLDIIDLTGDAIVRIPEERSGISADYIKLWMDPIEAISKKSKDVAPSVPRFRQVALDNDLGNPTKKKNTAKKKKKTPRPLPHRLLAIDDVTMVSPELQGRTRELQVWFDPMSGAMKKPLPLIQPASAKLDGDNLVHTANMEPEKLRDPKKIREPVVVDAKLIRVRVLRHKDPKIQPQLAEVWAEGDVEITHRVEPNKPPMALSGSRLHLKNRGEDDQVVHIYGAPAKITDSSMNLEGEEILFDRKRNYVWSDGRGTLTLPVKNDLEGNPLKEPANMTTSWTEQMAFDGLEAVFVGRVHATLLNSIMRCQQMRVTLTKRLKFEQQETKQLPEISKVTARYHVEFDSHEMEAGGLTLVRRARFAEFALDQQTGRAEARGPGSVTVWKQGRGNRASLSPVAVARANRAANARDTKWEYTRIDFANEMVAKTKLRTISFIGQVQVVYGPVKEPLEVIDLDNLPKDGGAMYCDTLEFTQRTTVTDDKYVELLARDNARLEGRSFSAQAYAITFDESKGLYTLRSKGDQQAMLWREHAPGLPRTPVVAKTFMFNPARNFVDFDNASLVRGLQ